MMPGSDVAQAFFDIYALSRRTVVEEIDESVFWLELMENSCICDPATIQPLKAEANELLRIFSTSLTTAKRNARE